MMRFTLRKTALAFTALTLMGSGAAWAAEDAVFTDAQKDAMGAVIKDYLMENPNVIFEAIEAQRAQQEADAKKQAEVKILEHIDYLTRADAPSVGNPNADVTVVEFFDYNCGYCKRALPDIQKLVKEDPKVRVVFKEMAILGPSSKTAALWSLAAHKQGKYFEYHVALMNHRGAKDEAALMQLGKDAGLDVEKLKADANDPATEKMLEHDMDIARDIGANGTPAFIIGSQFIPGYVGEEGLKSAIAEERQKAGN